VISAQDAARRGLVVVNVSESGAVLDDLDRLIAEELTRDGRVTSSDLAATAGVSKATAASRVRRLIKAGVVRVTAVFDVDAAGFQWQVNCYIKSTGVPARDIAKELAVLPSTWAVMGALGRSDVVAVFMFADKAQMVSFFTEQLPTVDGVAQFECDLVMRPLWYEPLATNLIVHDPNASLIDLDVPIRFPNSVVDVDALDEAIIKTLRADGRRSNRRIGQELGVSEGTIRSRIKRLQEANLMRIVAWVDPEALDQTGHVLYLRLRLQSVDPRSAAIELAKISRVTSTSATIGWPSVTLMAVAKDRRESRDILAAVRAVAGVIDVDLHELVDIHFYRSQFVRIPAMSVLGSVDRSI
jgi:DNA-binding Lrp family transcriptional regulator